MSDVVHSTGVWQPKRIGSAGPAQRRFGHGVDFSNRQIALLFLLLSAMVSIPILLNPLPPLSDYINHLARMHIIASLGSDPDLARFYQVDWTIIPNLMMDLIVPTLTRFMNVYMAGQVYTVTSFLLILSGTLMLNRQLYGRWSVLPLIAFPLLYNNVFLVGTMNFVFGIGLALWAMATWVGLRERNVILRMGVSALFVLGLFICHLFALGVYGLALLAYELARLWTRRQEGLLARWRSILVDFLALGIPFLPVLPLLMMSPTWGLRSSVAWELGGKVDGLMWVIEVYSHPTAFLLTGIVAFAAGWGVRHRALSFQPFGWALLILGSIVYMAMPRIVFETYMADQRLPVSLAFMIVACADLSLRYAYVRRGFAALLVLLLAVRVTEVQIVWTDLTRSIVAFQESVGEIERGSKVAVAYADPDGGDDVHDLGLVHAACLAIIERSSLVTTAFTVVGKQVLHARADYRGRVDTIDGSPPTIAELVHIADAKKRDNSNYWSQWTSDYDYLYVLFTDPDYENPDPSRLDPVFTSDRFVLYKIINSRVAEAADHTN